MWDTCTRFLCVCERVFWRRGVTNGMVGVFSGSKRSAPLVVF